MSDININKNYFTNIGQNKIDGAQNASISNDDTTVDANITNLALDPNAVIGRSMINKPVPTGTQFLSEIIQFLNDNPEIAQRFNGAFEVAIEAGLPYDAALVVAEGVLKS